MLPAGYHIQKPFVITFSKIYDTIGVSASPFICLCLCICLCICICICLCIWIFVRIWIADIMGFQKIYDLRGPWGLTAVFQLIYELRKNCCGWTGGRTDGTEIEGSVRGPRGPNNCFSRTADLVLPTKKWMFLLQISILDGATSEKVTYKQALSNWLQNKRPFQALDDPMITNSRCPF